MELAGFIVTEALLIGLSGFAGYQICRQKYEDDGGGGWWWRRGRERDPKKPGPLGGEGLDPGPLFVPEGWVKEAGRRLTGRVR
jgi:hypothetical protein